MAGILSWDSSQGTLQIDFSQSRWSELGDSPERLIGLDEVIDLAVHMDSDAALVENLGTHLNRYLLAESTDTIWTATVSADLSGAEVHLGEAVGGIQALFGSQSADTLIASLGDDIMFAGRAEITGVIVDE